MLNRLACGSRAARGKVAQLHSQPTRSSARRLHRVTAQGAEQRCCPRVALRYRCRCWPRVVALPPGLTASVEATIWTAHAKARLPTGARDAYEPRRRLDRPEAMLRACRYGALCAAAKKLLAQSTAFKRRAAWCSGARGRNDSRLGSEGARLRVEQKSAPTHGRAGEFSV